MKYPLSTLAAICALAAAPSAFAGRPLAAAVDDFMDRLDEHLTVSLAGGDVKARFSGTFDLEAYSLPQPAPGLIFSERYSLLNPRLTLFFDAQLGPHFYIFLQARADQGFDPGYEPSRLALDEYAFRYTPWDDGRVSVQFGKFATVFGSWATRHGSWENPVVYQFEIRK